MFCGGVVLAVGIWYRTSSMRELCPSGARHDLVQWATGLGVSDTLGSGGGNDGCGVYWAHFEKQHHQRQALWAWPVRKG